ncbi:urease accessory protein UreE [Pseudooceanicola sp. MF1-13]|uniref:urease accessory protein UreE n=1 Tax=Pseudooceanicola sp. MF1-13 TaxID=3379095 RepID=UPI00389171C9
MSHSPVSHSILRAADLGERIATDRVVLDYEDRFLRRKMLTSVGGTEFLVDLPETLSLNHDDCFVIGDTLIAVEAAEEALIEVRGHDLVRLAWHIGNRHTPCQIMSDRLLIRQDKVMADMLAKLGAQVSEITAPFRPEGGAYGMGRTHGHDHSHVHVHVGHGHSHDHEDEGDEPL